MIYQGALQAFEDERLSWENRDKIHAYVESAKAQLEQETEAIERYYGSMQNLVGFWISHIRRTA